MPPQPELRVGLDYLDAVTTLLQRRRSAHPTKGVYQAAEVQWWWTIPRSTDALGQLFWFDDEGRPEAAVIATDFGDGSSALYDTITIVPIVLPDADPEWIAHVVATGLAHFADAGIEAVALEVGGDDTVLHTVMDARGFAVKEDGVIECWLTADQRPSISSLGDGYRLTSRNTLTDRPHHMMTYRQSDGFEQRLSELSLYRPELDLVVLDADDRPAAYGLFWYDPVTATGVVEPMRTLEGHQQRGLARHILTSGVDLLAAAGARRVSICFEPDNPASGPLYLSVGFEPHRRTDVYAGATR